MSVKIKAIQKGQPGVIGGGIKKYYASPVMGPEITLAQLTKAIEKVCTATGADIRAVLYALVDVITDRMSDGSIIRLGDLGSLRITLSSEGQATEELVNASTVKDVKVVFTPGTRIKELLNTVTFEKV